MSRAAAQRGKASGPPRIDWLLTVTPEHADGQTYGAAIHRYVPMDRWREQLPRVPEPHRNGAEMYLRQISARIRNVRAARRTQFAENARAAADDRVAEQFTEEPSCAT
jgi:hypothetical protein